MYKSSFVNNASISNENKARSYKSDMAEYTINACGFFRNDFAVLQESQNQLQMALALQRMQELSNGDSNKGKSFEEIVAMVRPRWCQSPAEMDRFEQYCIDNALELYKSLKKDTPDDVKEAVGSAVAVSDSVSKTE